MLQQQNPDDFVISTNETHSVEEFVCKAFAHLNLEWNDYVELDNQFIRPLDVGYLKGDNLKARKNLNWRPKVTFDNLVTIMVDADLDRWKRWKKGENFSWDANNYPNDEKILSMKSK